MLVGTRRDLLFVSAGNNHLLNRSLRGDRDFDIAIAWYGTDPRIEKSLREMADFFFVTHGGKFQNLWKLWNNGELPLEQYEAIFVADDDAGLSVRQISKLFGRRRELDAWIVSPAHTIWGVVSHRALLYRPRWDHHYTNFIEVNTPLFEMQALLRFLRVFDGSLSGWGIDHWYMNVLGEDQPNRYVIDDRVTFCNPRSRTRAGGREIEQLGSKRLRVNAWKSVRDEHGLREIQADVIRPIPAPLGVATLRSLAFAATLVRCLITQPAPTTKTMWQSLKRVRHRVIVRSRSVSSVVHEIRHRRRHATSTEPVLESHSAHEIHESKA